MTCEVTLDICGRRIALAVPLGAWEELARAGHDKPLTLERALREGTWTLAQAVDAFGIALKHGKSGLAASEAIAAHGLLACAQFAHAAVIAGLVPDEDGAKKNDAEPEPEATKSPSG
jgi:hypothetical protein